MDASLAQYGGNVGGGALLVLLFVSLLRGWLVVGSAVAAQLTFLTEALATERARGDRLETQNIKLMGFVEAGLTSAVVDSKQEAAS